MNTTESTPAKRDPLALVVRLLAARETLQNLWGAEYPTKICPWRELIRKGVANAKCSPLAVPAIMVANARKAGNEIDGMPLVALLAASVDETEGVAR